MNRLVVVHQPDFLPWLGFFDRLLRADLYVVLDCVQYINRGWMHRDRIKTPLGPQWLSLSVKKSPRGTPMSEIHLSEEVRWRDDNLALIRQNYRSAPFADEVMPQLERLYRLPTTSLVEFNLASIAGIMEQFDIHTQLIMASSLNPQGKGNDLIVDILRSVGATHYLSGQGARAYFEPGPFAAAGIEVVWQDFAHPVYPQMHGSFVPMLSAIDLLFNCGVKRSRELLGSS